MNSWALEPPSSLPQALSERVIAAEAATEEASMNRLLQQCIAERTAGRSVSGVLEQHLADHPNDACRVSLLLNLGLEAYNEGRFSKCLEAWPAAWEAGKDSDDPGVRAQADRAVAEWAKMLSRIGRVPELRALLQSVEGRNFRGMVAEMIQVARDALWVMEHKPEVSFRCGPHALQRILMHTGAASHWPQEIITSASPVGGIALRDVAALSEKVRMHYQMARRVDPTAEIPAPAVVHWKLDHYGAVVKREGDRYLLDDPTFQNGLLWIGAEALKEESSGAFLLPPGPLPAGWAAISLEEGAGIKGKGYPSNDQPGCTGPGNPTGKKPPKSPPPGGPPPGCGMADWDVYLMMCSLNVWDTPAGYSPPVGPDIYFNLQYNQRETNQPAVPNYANFGPLWSFDWIGSLTFDSANAYFNRGQGGIETFSGFDAATQSYRRAYLTDNQLVRLSTTSYELRYADGGKLVFALPDNAGAPTRIFMTQVVDAQGNAATLSYDATFRLTGITDAIGQTSTLTYGTGTEELLVKKITDPFGRFASFEYDANGNLKKITDVIGMASEFTYDAQDKLLTMLTPYGTTAFAYGTASGNRSVELTHPNGEKERFEQKQGNTPGVPANDPAATVPAGLPTFNQYLDGRNTFHWDRKAFKEAPGDYTKAMLYHFMHHDLNSRSPILESYKVPGERRVWLFYQGQSNSAFYSPGMMGSSPDRVARVLDDGTTQISRTSYNTAGLPTAVSDPSGRTATYGYSPNQLDVVETRLKTGPADSVKLGAATYHGRHLPLTATDTAGKVTTFSWNGRGQLTSITNANNETTSFNYNAAGYLTSIDLPLPGSTDLITYAYDAFGRLRTETGTDGYTLTYDYDALDRLTRITFPDGTYQETVWQRLDPVSWRDRRGRITSSTYDSLGQLTSVTDPLGRTLRYEWCRCGDLKSLIDPMNRITRWFHDFAGRVTAKQYADGSQEKYTYDLTGRLTAITDAKGQTKSFRYRPDDLLESIQYLNAQVPTPGVSYAYDPWFGRLASRTDGAGVTRYAYHPITAVPGNGAGRLAEIDGPLSNDTIAYTYDALGRVLNRSIGGAAESVVYDALSRVTSVTNVLGAFSYAYAGATGRVTSIAYPNGQSTSYDYFAASGDFRLREIWHKRPGGATLLKLNYTYDAEGQILTWSQQRDATPARVWTYGYDLADQLTSAAATNPAQTFAYNYDPAGNRLTEVINGATTAAAYDALNQLTSTAPPAGSDRTYEWDAEDRLVAINYTGTNQRSEFSYDGQRRCVRIVEKSGATITADRRFVWCGTNVCEERNSDGTVAAKFFVSHMTRTPGSNPSHYFFTQDHLGSVWDLTDVGGTAVSRYAFDPYGRRATQSEAVINESGFAGLRVHPPSGLGFAVYRSYNPNSGRWLNRDPIGEAGGVNLFSYVAGNPVVGRDPLGLKMLTGGVEQNVYRDPGGNLRDIIPLRPEESRSLGGSGDDILGRLPRTPEQKGGAFCRTHADNEKKRGKKAVQVPFRGALGGLMNAVQAKHYAVNEGTNLRGETIYSQLNGNDGTNTSQLEKDNMLFVKEGYIQRTFGPITNY